MSNQPAIGRPVTGFGDVSGRWLAGVAAAIGLAIVVSVPAQAVDSVIRRSDGVTLRGEFTSLGVAEIKIKLSDGKIESVSTANLRDVRFDREPNDLLSVRSNERSGALDAAMESLTKIQSDYSGGNKDLQTELDFLMARIQAKQALTNPDGVAEALKSLLQFRNANKSNFRYLEACLLEASLHALGANMEAGKALLQEVENSPVTGFQLQAGVQLGRLLLASGNAAEAQSSFDKVIQQSSGDPDAVTAMYAAMLGRALCLKQQNQLDEAISTLDQVIAKAGASEDRILADAWVRKGDCLRQKNQTKPALMAYLRVDVLYPGEPALHAESLLRLSQLWGPAGHADRAQEAATRLAEQYPNSQWTKQIGQGG